jgi:ABC-type nitrate/sulfonate/bicarbonate transport system substrate-binding protein
MTFNLKALTMEDNMRSRNRIGSVRTCWFFVIVLASILITSGTAPAAAQERIDFKVGLAAMVNTALPLYLADAGGFYANQGLKVIISDMGGGSRGAQALETGEIQVMHVGLSGVVSRNVKGGNLRVIASLSNVMRFTFFSDPRVKTATDLKGGIIGVSSFGSESDSAATLALQKLGLTRADVTFKEVGGSPQRLAAIKSGAIKAAAMNEPVATMAHEQGLYPMVDLFAEQIPWLFTGLTIDKKYFDGNRELLVRFMKATLEGSYRGLADEKWAKEVLAKEFKLSDPRVINIAYNDFKAQMPENAMPTKAATENVLAQLQSFGIKLKSQKVEDYVDTSIIDALIKDGTLAGLQKKYGKP